jgi:superfamily II DNA or RNA helicase
LKTIPTTRAIRATVGSHLLINEDGLPSHIVDFIKQALIFPNPEKEVAKKQHLWNAHELPDEVFLWEKQGSTLVLPRGFATDLREGLNKLGYRLEWNDKRHSHSLEQWAVNAMTPIELRDYQEQAAQQMCELQQGVFESPTGSGKTITMLEAIRRIAQRSLIIVDKTNIAEQWRKEARDKLNVELGLIGDNEWGEAPITVALVQSLWSSRELLESDWWGQWGLVVLDECHHAPAFSFQDIIQRFPAKFRFGLSATPKKGGRIVPYAQKIIGPNFKTTTSQELKERGILVHPC